MKCLFQAVGWLALMGLSAQVAAHKLWTEAESGAEYSPILVKSDPGASERIYLANWNSQLYDFRTARNGYISFDIYVPTPGRYTLWARTRIPYSGVQAYDVSFADGDVNDDAQWTRWAPDQRDQGDLGQWTWSAAGLTVDLPQGSQQIHLVQRAGGSGVHLDKLLLTDDLQFTPEGLGGAEPSPDIGNDYLSPVVARHGQLQVTDGQLLDQHQNPVQLRGISSHGLQWFPLVDDQTIPNLAQWFNVDVVRLAMYVEAYAPSNGSDYWGGYMADPVFMRAKLEAALEDAIAAGIYVVVDWHIHNIPQAFAQEAMDFFDDISRRYGHHPHVIYEICNEPTASSWSGGIKPYAEQVIDVIRANDPDNIIIVGTPNWSQDVDAAARDPLEASNVMYAMHYYAASHDFSGMRAKLDTALDAGLAVFVSEWGASDVDTTRLDLQVASQWVEYLNQHAVSWINWSLGNKDETSSILRPSAPLSGPWDESDLTPVGRWLRPYLLAPRNQQPGGGDPPPEVRWQLSAQPTGKAMALAWSVTGLSLEGYEIYRDQDADASGWTHLATVDSAKLAYEDLTAEAGVTYYYWIKAIYCDQPEATSPATSGVVPIAAAPSPAVDDTFQLISRQSGKALAVAGANRNASASMVQANTGWGGEQRWRMEKTGGAHFRLINAHSQQCLDVPWGTHANGARMQQWWCHDRGPQLWEFIARGDGYFAIRNVASGKCLDVSNFSHQHGAAIIQWDCHFKPNQLWRPVPR